MYEKRTLHILIDQYQLASLFNTDRSRIVRHIVNIYSDKELDNSTCSKMEQVQTEGNRVVGGYHFINFGIKSR